MRRERRKGTGGGAHLGSGAADLAHVAVVDLGGLRGLLGLELLVLEGGLLGEGAAGPCRGRCCGCHGLLLLLLLVVRGGSGVHRRLVARVRRSCSPQEGKDMLSLCTRTDAF